MKNETKKILEYVSMCGSRCNVLDVGCGYGAKMIPLMEVGHNVVGIDVNEETAVRNRNQGLKCYHVNETLPNTKYDVLLLSHVIEHLLPEDLITFMDKYIGYLKAGSHIVIATPLLSSRFYDDFTHKRPYPISSISQMFGSDVPVSKRSEHVLELKCFWYRRNPHISVMHGGKSIYSLYGLFASWLYSMSFGYIGEVDGYVALFKVIK